jgi:hypothetical protein
LKREGKYKMNKTTKKQALIRLRFEGIAVRNNTILFDDLSTFVSNISLAIDRVIQKLLQKDVSIRRGRPPRAIQILSALEIVSVRKGCFSIGLDLRRNGQQFPGWDMGEQAVDILMRGLKTVEGDGQLPEEYDTGVMMALRDAGRVIDRGIDKVSLNSASIVGKRRAIYTLQVREGIVSRLQRLERGYAVVEGRLVMLDVEEDKLVCRIRPSTGDPILCKYDEELAELVIKNIRQFVRLKGEATYDLATNKIAFIYIKDLESIGESASIGITQLPISSFWKGKTFDELAAAQGIYPIDDISRLSKDWPEKTDFDAFLEAVRSART